MLKKNLSIIFIVFLTVFSLCLFTPREKEQKIIKINSPISFELENESFELVGTESAQYRALGNAIAPVMFWYVAQAVAKLLTA